MGQNSLKAPAPMQPNQPDVNLWGNISKAAEFYCCTEHELILWCSHGLVRSAWFRRDGIGWIIPLLRGHIDVPKLRARKLHD